MAAGEQIAFEPTLAHVLAEHFHDAAVGAEVDIDRLDLGHPLLAGDFIDGLQPVGGGFVRAEQPEILLAEIELHHVAQECSEHARCFGLDAAGLRERPRRSRGNAASTAAAAIRRHWRAGWSPFGDGRSARARRVLRGICRCSSNNSCGAIALHPVFELLEMFGVVEVRDRNLMRPPCALDRQAVDEFRSGPALGRAEDDHRPARALRLSASPPRSGGTLDLADLRQDRIERAGKQFDAPAPDRRPRRNADRSRSRATARSVPPG